MHKKSRGIAIKDYGYKSLGQQIRVEFIPILSAVLIIMIKTKQFLTCAWKEV
jgi:hypothetical protein